MARRKSDTPQKAAMREMMQEYLRDNDISIKSGTDVNSIMRDMMSVLLEGALDEELNEELGYSKYDYRNKDTDNSRNGHSKKTMHTVRRHIVGGANRTLISVKLPLRLCRTGTCRRLLAE